MIYLAVEGSPADTICQVRGFRPINLFSTMAYNYFAARGSIVGIRPYRGESSRIVGTPLVICFALDAYILRLPLSVSA